MSYIPDYRSEENEKHLNDVDTAFLAGYRCAVEDALCFFDNLDVYDLTDKEEHALADAKDCLEDWLDTEEVEAVCSIFDSADYIPDGVEIKDMNRR